MECQGYSMQQYENPILSDTWLSWRAVISVERVSRRSLDSLDSVNSCGAGWSSWAGRSFTSRSSLVCSKITE